MSIDIRKILQASAATEKQESCRELDNLLGFILEVPDDLREGIHADATFAISYIEGKGYDWIMANVNGQLGGTPYACVGVTEVKASFAATPVLSMWLSFFRFELGDEREQDK